MKLKQKDQDIFKFIDTCSTFLTRYILKDPIYIYLLAPCSEFKIIAHQARLNNITTIIKVKEYFYNSYKILLSKIIIHIFIHFPRINEACVKFAWLNETFYFPSGNRFTVDIEINDLLTGIRGNG